MIVKGSIKMIGGFLLDTNVVIGILERDDSVTNRFPPLMRLLLPCIAMGELFYRARSSSRAQHNLARLAELSKALPLLPRPVGTAHPHANPKADLRNERPPIPA